MAELALVQRGFTLAEVRGLTAPELQSYVDLLSGKATTATRRVVNQRLKRK